MKSSVVLPFYAKLTFVLVGIIAMGYLAILGQQILSPLLFSLLFSILLLPLANFLEIRLKFPRSVSAFVSVFLLVASIFGLIYLLGSQLTSLASDWPLLKHQVLTSITELHEWIDATFHINTAEQVNYMNDATSKMLNASTAVIGATVLSLSSVMLFLVFVLIYTFFLLFHRGMLIKFMVAVFPKEYSALVYEISSQVKAIIMKYLVGLFLQACVVAIITCVVFVLLNVKYPLLLGLITGIFNVIPYIGIFSALLLGTLISFASAGASHALLVAVAIIVIHMVDSNYIMPKVVGSKVQLNPLIVVLGVVLGEMVWGISGMVLSIPILAIFKIIFDRVETLNAWGILLGDEEHVIIAEKVIELPAEGSHKFESDKIEQNPGQANTIDPRQKLN
jgi:putative permease